MAISLHAEKNIMKNPVCDVSVLMRFNFHANLMKINFSVREAWQ